MRKDRCPECGGKRMLWSPREIIQRVREFAEDNGRPPTIREWRDGTEEHPSYSTVCYMFGSWRAMLRDAGLKPNGVPIVWTKARIADAFVDWRIIHGRWPTVRDWTRASEDHPCAATVISTYGGWNTGRVAAGYTGSPKEKHRALDLAVA